MWLRRFVMRYYIRLYGNVYGRIYRKRREKAPLGLYDRLLRCRRIKGCSLDAREVERENTDQHAKRYHIDLEGCKSDGRKHRVMRH